MVIPVLVAAAPPFVPWPAVFGLLATLQNVATISSWQITPVLVSGEVTVWPARAKRLLLLVGYRGLLRCYGRRRQKQRNDARELHTEPRNDGGVAPASLHAIYTQVEMPLPANVSV